MATPSWHISGQYYENCNCDFVCPCIPGQLAVKPTKGSCTVAMAFQVGQGSHGTVSLDGLGFIVLLFTPEEMCKGNWSVGIVDARASGPAPDRTDVRQRCSQSRARGAAEERGRRETSTQFWQVSGHRRVPEVAFTPATRLP